MFHVSARAISTQALSIFGDHSDVMATRQTQDLRCRICIRSGDYRSGQRGTSLHFKGESPFVHFFDGFRTSHEIQKVELIDYDVYKKLIDMDAVNEFRQRALTPEHPKTIGTAQNPDVYFQGREAQNKHYDAIPDIVEYYMDEIAKETGRHYKAF